jgi:bacteriocin biosynthesis cyclodehydratase domain-containing protein
MSNSDLPLPLAEVIHFKDSFGIIVLNPDDVEFRTGSTSGRSFFASDSERRGLLGPIVEKILSPQGSVRPWNEAESDLLTELIPELLENGIIEPNPETQIDNKGAGIRVAILPKPLKEARIGIVGHGVLGNAVRVFLRDAPCESITVIESSSVANTSSLRKTDLFAPPLATVAMDAERRIARPSHEGEWIEAIKDHDWVIAAQDCFEPEELSALNNATLRLRVPWSLVCFDGYEGWVGPTFVPGQTACFSCFRRRLFAGAAEPKHVFRDPGVKVYRVPSPWSVGPEASAWVSLIASMFAIEVIAATNGKGFSLNQILIVHRLNLTFARESVLRLPRCQSCSPRRNAPKLNVFANLLKTRAPTVKVE